MKKKGKEIKAGNSLQLSLYMITLIPLLLIALILTAVGANRVATGIQEEVNAGLKNMANTFQMVYSNLYPGDYSLVESNGGVTILKGTHALNGDYELIDEIKERTGNDITFFYKDTSIITSIRDENGQRMVGAGASAHIIKKVLDEKEEMFLPKVQLNGIYYSALYMPVQNTDGTTVGMLLVTKSQAEVQRSVNRTVFPSILIAVLGLLCAAVIVSRYSYGLIHAIQIVEKFLGRVAMGNLQATLEPEVLKRTDEVGEMGRDAVHMQAALRELISKDALTGLNNRRYGEEKLSQVMEKAEISGQRYTVSIGDIDFFKKVNDTYGHECGDVVLKHIAKILQEAMVSAGFVARWGGEEFLLVFEKDDLENAREKLNRIRLQIEASYVEYQDFAPVRITMTFGIVEPINSEQMNTDVVLRAADVCLYHGKMSGRNRVIADYCRGMECEENEGENHYTTRA